MEKRNWLKIERIKAGFTQEEIAKQAEIAKPTYCSYEQGTRTPRWDTAKALGEILNFDPVLFFDPEVDETQTNAAKNRKKVTN